MCGAVDADAFIVSIGVQRLENGEKRSIVTPLARTDVNSLRDIPFRNISQVSSAAGKLQHGIDLGTVNLWRPARLSPRDHVIDSFPLAVADFILL